MKRRVNMSQEVAIIEFGSSEITVIIARRGINNTFDIRGMGKTAYAGFFNGNWLKPELLRNAIKSAISAAENTARTKIRDIFVGVPGEFSTVVSKEVTITFKMKQRVTPNEVDALYEMGDTFAHNQRFKVINRSPIYYTLDDNQRVIDPVGMQTSVLRGRLSYILAERIFLKKISAILTEFDFRTVEYVSSVLAESLFLFEPELRDRGVLLVDVGFLTTNVAMSYGDGLLHMMSIPTGGAHVEFDLLECLGLRDDEYKYAVKIKRQVALSLEVGDTDKYEVETENGVLTVSARLVHDIVNARLEYMADSMKKCFDNMHVDYLDKKYRLFLSGGGISYMRGAREALGRFLGKPCELAVGIVPRYNKPGEAAEFGLLDLALKNAEPKKSFLGKVFG